MPLPLTVSCFSKIQIGFTILAPAHPGSPGQRVVKQMCVCVCLGPEKLCQNMHCLTSPVTVTIVAHTHTHPFNGPLSGNYRVSLYQKGKTNLDFTGARDSEWQWNPLGHMQVCTSHQTDNHASTPPSFFRPDALPVAQPTVSKH